MGEGGGTTSSRQRRLLGRRPPCPRSSLAVTIIASLYIILPSASAPLPSAASSFTIFKLVGEHQPSLSPSSKIFVCFFAPARLLNVRFGKNQSYLIFLYVSFNFATAFLKFDTFSSYHIVRTRIAKVTNVFPFCTIGISIYQTCILPYFVIPFTFSSQASSPLERSGWTDGRLTFYTPCSLSSFFSTERAGP